MPDTHIAMKIPKLHLSPICERCKHFTWNGTGDESCALVGEDQLQQKLWLSQYDVLGPFCHCEQWEQMREPDYEAHAAVTQGK